ncbi:monocarboxylate transporter 13 [Nephila pilipes]|uniref:Monocarboxylate transporter 13 n=1 Tax=Nephila pilipes TaxID=299642 RepID=A0A8X6QCS8_NEPPI|nr:monocarboxylate transporter 13 [Nephila pilipes]
MAPRPETERSEITGSAASCGLKNSLGSLSDMPQTKREGFPETVDNVPSKVNKIDQVPKLIVPPDGGWGWMVLLGTMTVNFVIIGHGKSFGVYFKKLMEEFDASPSRVAWIQSLQISVFCFLSPVASVLSQLIGPRKVALGGGLLAFFGLTISSLTPSLEYLYIFYGVVQGIAFTCTFTPGITMIAKYFYRRRGLANGLTMAGNALGGIVMPLVANKLISEFTIRGCFLIMASILLHACVGAMLWQPVEWHQKKKLIENVPILENSPQEGSLNSSSSPGKDTLYPQEDSQNTSIPDDHTVSNKDSMLIENFNFESGFDMSLDSSAVLKSSAPEILIERRDINMYSSGPNLYSNKSTVPNGNNKMIRGGSSPHLADMPKSNERTYGSSVSTESLPHMFKLAPRLLKHSSRASSFIYLSSYSFGPTVGAVLTKEHFTGLDASDSKVNSDDLIEATKHKKWRLSPCLRNFPIDRSIFEKSRFYIMTVTLFFSALGYPGTQIFLPYRATSLGLSEAQAASLLSVLAFTDLIGRISCAWISDFNFCPRKYWFIGGMFMSGVFGLSLPFYKSYVALLAGTAGFGFFCGAYIGLIVVLFADAYSSEKVALAYSLSTVFGGFMALGGPPLMGKKILLNVICLYLCT